MFTGGYFSKSYFAGTYWAPAEGAVITPDGSFFPYPVLRYRGRR
jgi:hypothetical protein